MTSAELRLMTLREVHELYGIPLKDLKIDTKSGLAPCVPIGKGTARTHRRMTEPQVREYLEIRSRQAMPAEAPRTSTDPLREAVQATKRSQARHRGHRAFTR